jgi:hypothetical protein
MTEKKIPVAIQKDLFRKSFFRKSQVKSPKIQSHGFYPNDFLMGDTS